MTRKQIIAEWLRNSAIAFWFVIGGFLLAGALSKLWGAHSSIVYMACLSVGMIPFCWFARQRGALAFSVRDYILISGCVVATAAITEVAKAEFPGIPDNSMVVRTVRLAVLVALVGVYWQFRKANRSEIPAG